MSGDHKIYSENNSVDAAGAMQEIEAEVSAPPKPIPSAKRAVG